MRGTSRLAVATAAVVLFTVVGGCSVVTRSHEATVLAPPSQDGSPLASDRWSVHLELARGDIAGSSDVRLAFDRHVLMCDDGSELSPLELGTGTVVRFVRDDGEVETSDPPGVAAREIRAEC